MTARRRVKRRSYSEKSPSGLTIRRAKLSRARPFKWVWDQRVLLGYVNLIAGEEGIGKGNLAAWLGAGVTTGTLPGNLNGRPRNVAFTGDEDSWENIWVPRLHAADADLDRLTYIEFGPDNKTLDLTNAKHVAALKEEIRRQRLAVVYFDQLLDNLGYTDSWKDKEVRDALAPLRRIARETDCACMLSLHPNKRKGSFRDRLSGSPAFNTMSRSSLLVARHPHDRERRVVVRPKGNYTVEPDAFEFTIEERALRVRGRSIITSRITDAAEAALRAADVLDDEPRTESSQVGLAQHTLAELFQNGSCPAEEVLDRMKAEGFSPTTITRARKKLGIETWKDGFQGPWVWGYPSQRNGGEGQ